MKAIYLSTTLLSLSLSALAQTNYFSHPVLPGLKKNYLIKGDMRSVVPGINLPEYGVKKLKQDNMPCLVPDITSVIKIPNREFYLTAQTIPNPYKPTGIFPGLENSDPSLSTPGLIK